MPPEVGSRLDHGAQCRDAHAQHTCSGGKQEHRDVLVFIEFVDQSLALVNSRGARKDKVPNFSVGKDRLEDVEDLCKLMFKLARLLSVSRVLKTDLREDEYAFPICLVLVQQPEQHADLPCVQETTLVQSILPNRLKRKESQNLAPDIGGSKIHLVALAERLKFGIGHDLHVFNHIVIVALAEFRLLQTALGHLTYLVPVEQAAEEHGMTGGLSKVHQNVGARVTRCHFARLGLLRPFRLDFRLNELTVFACGLYRLARSFEGFSVDRALKLGHLAVFYSLGLLWQVSQHLRLPVVS